MHAQAQAQAGDLNVSVPVAANSSSRSCDLTLLSLQVHCPPAQSQTRPSKVTVVWPLLPCRFKFCWHGSMAGSTCRFFS